MSKEVWFRAEISESNVSCGVDQLFDLITIELEDNWEHDINLTRDALKDWIEDNSDLTNGVTYVFSDADENGNGISLAKLIRKFKLGKIVTTGPVTNPGSGRKIRTWLWVYNGSQIPSRKVKKAA